MASLSGAGLGALAALLIWAGPGLVLARRLPLGLGVAAAPILGWGICTVAALAAASLLGFTAVTVAATSAVVAAAAFLCPRPRRRGTPAPALPLSVLAAAAVVALGPAAGVLPKISAAGIALADPLYDHAKIALVDEIVRNGVPPANPFVGSGDGDPGSITYYYYWLFGAAELARVTGASGWEADAAATWFTALASLSLMCGLAFRLAGGRMAAPVFVLAVACGGSLRPVIAALAGEDRLDAVLERQSGLAGWFLQTSWSPHHVAAAAAVVLALIVMERLARRPSAAATVAIAALVAAAFGSSLWVGGVAFVPCAGAAAAVLVLSAPPARRPPFAAALVVAACLAVVLVLPLMAAQFQAAAERGGGLPVTIAPFSVFAPAVPAAWRRWLDPPAFWLILLPIEFPAAALLGAVAACRLKSPLMPVLSAAAVASLCGGWMLVSTVGENDDLGWRAVLPGVMILTAFAGAWFARAVADRRLAAAVAAVALVALAWPDGADLVRGNLYGRLSRDAVRLADAPLLWAAVRRHTGTTERVASNPRLMASLTPWPINASWALLADRRSCFAGGEFALAFSAWPPPVRTAAADLFDRVFAGTAGAADLRSLVQDYGCRVVVLTPQDDAFVRDPFTADPAFTVVENESGRWRIYRAN